MSATAHAATRFRAQAFAAPYLDHEEERLLINNVQVKDCVVSAKRLAESHFRYVAACARKFSRVGVDIEDLIQQGCIGLLRAIKMFDLKHSENVRFITYAQLHIKAEIVNYVVDNVRTYRIATTKAQRKLYFNLHKFRDADRSWLTNDEVTMIAQELNVTEEDVRVMEGKLRATDMSIDADENQEVVQSMACHTNPAKQVEREQWEAITLAQVDEAVSHLKEQERDVFYHRVVAEEKKTLRELAEQYGVSAERIRQVEIKATAKVREFVERFA